jgi:Tripartite tricarboxylate transporter family receptor
MLAFGFRAITHLRPCWAQKALSLSLLNAPSYTKTVPKSVLEVIQNLDTKICQREQKVPGLSMFLRPLGTLAISTAARSALLPSIPTLRESGVDVEADAWNGVIAPAGTPDPIVARIAREVSQVLTAADVRDKLATQLMEPIPGTPAEFRPRIEADLLAGRP